MDPFCTNDKIVAANTYGHLMKGFFLVVFCTMEVFDCIADRRYDGIPQISFLFQASGSYCLHTSLLGDRCLLGLAGFLTMCGYRLLFCWTIAGSG
jgi:hypothetical protein